MGVWLMVVWIGVWMGGCLDVRMGVWMGGWMGIQMGGWMGIRMGGWVGIRMGGWTGVWWLIFNFFLNFLVHFFELIRWWLVDGKLIG